MTPEMTVHPNDVDQLNSFLRGEISAVETYDQALEQIDEGDSARILRDCRTSHARRVTLLEDKIRQVGGEPAEGSGPWGSFAQAIEGGAKLFGDSAAVAALATGEQHGLNDYRRDYEDLSGAGRSFLAEELLPEQESTLGLIESLKELV